MDRQIDWQTARQKEGQTARRIDEHRCLCHTQLYTCTVKHWLSFAFQVSSFPGRHVFPRYHQTDPNQAARVVLVIVVAARSNHFYNSATRTGWWYLWYPKSIPHDHDTSPGVRYHNHLATAFNSQYLHHYDSLCLEQILEGSKRLSKHWVPRVGRCWGLTWRARDPEVVSSDLPLVESAGAIACGGWSWGHSRKRPEGWDKPPIPTLGL